LVLAREESIYTNEQIKEEKQFPAHKKKRKSYIFEKIVVMAIVGVVFVCSMIILTRFTSITEARYSVDNLEKQLEELETEKTKLRIEVEKVLKSGWIEDEAKTRLQMDYPTAEQVICINVNPAKVAMLTGEINKQNYDDSVKVGESKNIYAFLKKLISYTKI